MEVENKSSDNIGQYKKGARQSKERFGNMKKIMDVVETRRTESNL